MASILQNTLYGSRSFGKKTEAANTVITLLVPPIQRAYTRLVDLWYTCGVTAHTMTVMRPFGRTTVASAAAASQAVINITADPGSYSSYGTLNTANNLIAASDYCVYKTADGNYVVDTVSSVSTLAITMATNVPAGTVAAGAFFWFYGVAANTNPATGRAHEAFTLPASTTTYFGSDAGEGLAGFFETIPGLSGLSSWPLNGQNEPLIIYIDNATNAGVLEKVTAIHTGR